MWNIYARIPLTDVLKHYFNYKDEDFIRQGRNIYLTKCPLHNEQKGTSFSIYDKTDIGQGWDWFCFGVCHSGGNASKLLVDSGKFKSVEEAIKDLKQVFKIELPDKVTVQTFAEVKGFDIDFLKSRGIDDHTHICNGEYIHGVAIPFYDQQRNIIAIKKRLKFEGTGKYMFTEGSNSLYGLDLLETYTPDRLYICEGETDALTILQAGLQAVGVPGASAWKEEWRPYLDKFTEIVCLADNDKAGLALLLKLGEVFPDKLYTINLPARFKDVNEFFLYGCAGNKESFHSYFTTNKLLPATPATFIKLLNNDNSILSNKQAWKYVLLHKNNPIDQQLFLEELKNNSKISKKLLNQAFREITSQLNCGSVETEQRLTVKNNCYYKQIFTEKGAEEVKISNFIIHLLHTIETDGDHVRICRLVNEHGQVSRLVKFDSETLTKPVEFMSECKKAGNYIFKGDFKDLISVNEILLNKETNVVHAPDHIGRIGTVWLMGRYGIDKDGNIVDADEHGIIALNEENYTTRNLNITDGNDETYMPTKPETIAVIDDSYLARVAATLKENIGSFEAYMALGFCVAGWHSNEIYYHRGDKSFPIFFINGKRNSGKTYLARWLMSAYGFNHLEGKNFAMPTVVSMTRKMGYYSSLPQWYDDYRNNIKDIKYRDEFLLGVYNRQGADKGTKSGFGVRSERIRGFLLLSGEDTPDDNAVFSRCNICTVSAYNRNDDKLNEMLDLVTNFPSMGLYFLCKKQKEGSQQLLEQIDEVKEILISQGIDARLAKNRAVFAGAFLYGFKHLLEQEEVDAFINWLCATTQTVKKTTENDHSVSRFFSDIAVLIAENKIVNGKHFKVEGDKMFLWFKAVYDAWQNNYEADIKRTVLLSYIQKEPFFIETDAVKKLNPQDNKAIRCLVINLSKVQDEDFVSICKAADLANMEF